MDDGTAGQSGEWQASAEISFEAYTEEGEHKHPEQEHDEPSAHLDPPDLAPPTPAALDQRPAGLDLVPRRDNEDEEREHAGDVAHAAAALLRAREAQAAQFLEEEVGVGSCAAARVSF